jgi:hypothetical protein
MHPVRLGAWDRELRCACSTPADHRYFSGDTLTEASHTPLCRAAPNGDVAYSNETVNGHVNADRPIMPEVTR